MGADMCVGSDGGVGDVVGCCSRGGIINGNSQIVI